MSWSWKEPTETKLVADLFAQFSGFAAELLLAGWMVLVALLVYATVRPMRRRRATAKARRETDALTARSAPEWAGRAIPKDTSASQIERLFGILESRAASVERAMTAHDAAARHLDSAEYQLLRLFDEFPMLAAGRSQPRRAANIAVVPPATPAAQAMAA